ncbi:MAG: transcriptional repressor [Armatimonadetes bacterium]|nr:transcriptional repressor [Armatimonadota bacterium]
MLRALVELGCARDAEEIHAGARRYAPGMGRVTVYRMLDVMQAEGLVQQLHFGGGRSRYELARTGSGHHHHLICQQCGVVAVLDGCLLGSIDGTRLPSGIHVVGHRLELVGICAPCQKRVGEPRLPGAA